MKGNDDLLLVIPWLGTALLWYSLGETSNDFRLLITLGTILATGLVASLEDGPCFSIMALWVIVYPAYMHERVSKGGRQQFGAGLLATMAFTGTLLYLNAPQNT